MMTSAISHDDFTIDLLVLTTRLLVCDPAQTLRSALHCSRCGKDTAELKKYRDGKVTPPDSIAAGANHWETGGGKAMQVELKEAPFKHS